MPPHPMTRFGVKTQGRSRMRNVAQAVMWPSRLRTCRDHDRIERNAT